MTTVTVYTKPTGCGQCIATKRHLDGAGVDYTAIDITDPANAAALEDLKAQDLLQAPVVVVGAHDVDDLPLDTGRVWSGYRPDIIDDQIVRRS